MWTLPSAGESSNESKSNIIMIESSLQISQHDWQNKGNISTMQTL